MKCSNCGKDLVDGTMFCDGCGAKVNAQPAAQPPVQPMGPQPVGQQPYYGGYQQPPKKGSGAVIAIIIMAVIILIGAGIGIFFLVSGGDKKNENNTNNNGGGNGNGNGNVNVVENNVLTPPVENNITINTNTNNTVNPTPSGNKLVCTQTQSTNVEGFSIKIEQELTLGFISGKVSDANLVVLVTIPDDLYQALGETGDIEENMDLFAEQLEESFSQSFGSAVTSMTSSHSGKVITIRMGIDTSAAGTADTYDAMKSYFQQQGYTCR